MKNNQPVSQIEIPFPQEKYLVSKTDLKGAITYVNDAYVELSGFSREELIGKNHNLVRHPDMPPQAFEDLWRTVKSGLPWRGVVKNRAKNGDHYWVEAFVVPIRENDQTVGYMSVRSEPSREQVKQAEALYRQSGRACWQSWGLWRCCWSAARS
jgi:aerotaxis receptor